MKSTPDKQETPPQKDPITFWTDKIHSEGSALIHGKFHPDWFNQDKNIGDIEPLEKEPSFADAGHINSEPKELTYAWPLMNDLPSNIFQYGNFPGSARKFDKTTDQLVLLSPSTPPSNNYNVKMLDNRFEQDWRELDWAFEVKEHAHAPFRTPTNPVILRIFLPDQNAQDLFGEIQNNPKLPEQLMRHLYPNLPAELVGTTQLFAKKLTREDLNNKSSRLGPIESGGEFIPLN